MKFLSHKKSSHPSRKKLFTLIELLVVIAIIGTITSISFVYFGNVRQKSRDTKRVTDIKLIQKTLEDYYRNEGSYPAALIPGQNLVGSSSNIVYMQIPENPSPKNDGPCSDSDYIYERKDGGYLINFCVSEATSQLSAGEKCATPQGIKNEGCTINACQGISSVSYGGQQYDTVAIGSQCWFRENLNIGTMVSGITQTDNSILEKYCYNDNPSNCQNYGGLYQWAETVQYLNGVSSTTDWNPAPSGNVQGVCPTDWHIPTNDEWLTLTTYLTGNGYPFVGAALKASPTALPVPWDGNDN